MKTAREYHARTPAHSIGDTDISTGYASRLWETLTTNDVRRRVGDISKRFTGAGWKNLPQELVDEIMGYLLDDLVALKACSLACKCLFATARPLIHQKLVCLGPREVWHPPKPPLISRRKRVTGLSERLINADRLGVLHHTGHLTFKPGYPHSCLFFNPGDLQECLPHFRSITKLHTLTLIQFRLRPFIPVFNGHFGIFTNVLRHLDIRKVLCTVWELLYIICQFPRLEDLTIMSPAREGTVHPPLPKLAQSPPLRGTLALVYTPWTDRKSVV